MNRESMTLNSDGSITARATLGPLYSHRSNFHAAAAISGNAPCTSGNNHGWHRLVFCPLSNGQGGTTPKSDPA